MAEEIEHRLDGGDPTEQLSLFEEPERTSHDRTPTRRRPTHSTGYGG
jgi:hypothetical protein